MSSILYMYLQWHEHNVTSFACYSFKRFSLDQTVMLQVSKAVLKTTLCETSNSLVLMINNPMWNIKQLSSNEKQPYVKHQTA